ncbi:hypothetical protein ACFQMJ_13800 [Cohnella cellulosilytica]|uniref:Uncharacterized protein n=1 Tax=Cohnella cellulosilytica TaxID=986710 RepID=A0ABW2F9D7_9BACL
MIITVFCLYPVIKSVDLVLYVRYDYYRNIVYERGFDNFGYVINDPEFWLEAKNTCIVVVPVVLLSMTLSLGIAYFLHAGGAEARVIQTAFFLPLVALFGGSRAGLMDRGLAIVWNCFCFSLSFIRDCICSNGYSIKD